MAAANVVLISAITDGDVEITIRAESKPAGVMIFVRHVQLQHHPFRGWIRGQRLLVGNFKFRQANGDVVLRGAAAAKRSRIVGVELPVLLKFWMQRQANQSALIEALLHLRKFGAQVEKK